MADLSGLSNNFFATPKEGFTTTLSSSISSGAATVPLNSVTGYTNGAVATFVVDPTDPTKKQVFTGVIDTSGIQVTSVKWTEGTNQSHTTGATVVDYTTATHFAALVKGLTTSIADQDGTLKAGAVDVTAVIADGVITKAKFATAEKAVFDSGWSTKYGDTTFPTPNTITALGNRSYTCVFNSVDLTGTLTPGMKLLLTRTVAAPTQCTSLNGTTQYFSKASPAGMTFTDDFVVSAWVKVSSYTHAGIVSRWNGTSGWNFVMLSTGQIRLEGTNAAAANFSNITSYQSLPLNKWVHVSAQLDMSSFTNTTTTSYVMIDGVDVPSLVNRAGTNPTTLVQAGNLEIGSYNGGSGPFPGKIAQVAIYNAKVTQATILASMNQTLSGSETSLISAYSFNNSINDLSANANNLTANGAVVATNADSPFAQGATAGTLEYGIITAVSFSTNTTVTVQVPEGSAIPTSGGVSAVSYATQGTPYGFPAISKFKLSAWDNSGTLTNPLVALMVQYVVDCPIDGLIFANASNAGGSSYLYVRGSTRQMIGGNSSFLSTSASATQYFLTMLTGFFTAVTEVNWGVSNVQSIPQQFVCGASGFSSVAQSFYAWTLSGSGGVNASWVITGY